MSATTEAWIELYAAQTETIGAITATVEGVAVNKRCIPVESPWNRVNADDGGGREWDETREVQMLVSDFTAPPEEHADIRFSDDDRPAQLQSYRVNNGVYYLTVEFVDVDNDAFSYVQPDGQPYYQPDGVNLYLQPT